MLKVLVTVDIDTYPIHADWKQDGLARDIKRDVYGEVDGRSVGLRYQLKVFAKHGLKVNFMVESLFSAVPEVGLGPLQEIVHSVLDHGHEIQLHPHTEWIPFVEGLGVPFRSHLLRDYTQQEQERIIRFARNQLEAAGSPTPVGFRAGGFAGNLDTLKALERCGVRYDSSFNPCYRDTHLHLPLPRFHGHGTTFGTVHELPVAVFEDHPSHLRPAQLCACSFAEMSHALIEAERQGWEFFVIVSHSFEMLYRRRHPTKPPIIRDTVVDRFEQLCQFLGSHRDRFETVGFSDLQPSAPMQPTAAIKGKLANTGARVLSQAWTRIRSA